MAFSAAGLSLGASENCQAERLISRVHRGLQRAQLGQLAPCRPLQSRHLPSRRHPRRLALLAVAAIADRTLFVKLSMAGIKGALDLSEMNLTSIPPEVFEIEDLKVCSREFKTDTTASIWLHVEEPTHVCRRT